DAGRWNDPGSSMSRMTASTFCLAQLGDGENPVKFGRSARSRTIDEERAGGSLNRLRDRRHGFVESPIAGDEVVGVEDIAGVERVHGVSVLDFPFQLLTLDEADDCVPPQWLPLHVAQPERDEVRNLDPPPQVRPEIINV